MTSSRDDIIQHLVNGGATVEEAVSMLLMYDVEEPDFDADAFLDDLIDRNDGALRGLKNLGD